MRSCCCCCPCPAALGIGIGPRLRSFLRDYDALHQTLGRTYAVLLFFAIVLDVAWFILFSHAIWNITPEEKLGVSSSTPTYHEVNYDGRNSFLSPRSSSVRRNSMADDILGGSIYDPAYYSSLFEDVRNNTCTHQGDKQSGSNDSGSTSAGQSPRLKSFASRSFVANDVEAGLRRPLNS
uniref:Uncharacterized protein n=1 Tax=Oryza glumipatula TaxID=40148 RepID=A0A0E0AHD8_9ORYZ